VRSPRQITKQKYTLYAIAADFCRIFEEHMNSLYLLSFLLTADHNKAKECFVRSLDDSAKSNRVFKEWAHSWARRAVIQNAIQMIVPRPTEGSTSSSTSDVSIGHALAKSAEIAAIVELPAFERFAFVVSILERYPDQQCSAFLNSTRDEVIAGRTRALQQIGKSAELRREPANIGSGDQTRKGDPGSSLQLETISAWASA
jgi:hypothetical protein